MNLNLVITCNSMNFDIKLNRIHAKITKMNTFEANCYLNAFEAMHKIVENP